MLNEGTKRKESRFFQTAVYEKKSRVSKIYSDKTWIQRIKIPSPTLLGIFSRLTGYAWVDHAYTFMRPFQCLIHFHDKFKEVLQRLAYEAAQDSSPGKTAAVSDATRHLRAYINFAEVEIVQDCRRFQQLTYTPSAPAPKKVHFTDVWYLFRPGEMVFMPESTMKRWLSGIRDPYIFHGSHEYRLRQRIQRLYHLYPPLIDPSSAIQISRETKMYVACLYRLNYDGNSYRPVHYEFAIPYFEGEKDIQDLDFYPLRFASGEEELLKSNKRIGEQFTDCVKQWHISYNGWTVVTDPMGAPIAEISPSNIRPEFVDSEVIVDFNEAFSSNPKMKSNFDEPELWLDTESETIRGPDFLALWSDRSRSELLSVSLGVIVRAEDIRQLEHEIYLEEDQYMGPKKDPSHIPKGDDLVLLPRRAFVKSLRESNFFAVDVRYMKPLDIRTDEFSRLQLPENHKRIIYSSVSSHLRRKRIEKVVEDDTGAGSV
ncbi:Fc.00g094260.m01.CDS01 [Cosmosporella sp. VM-42]